MKDIFPKKDPKALLPKLLLLAILLAAGYMLGRMSIKSQSRPEVLSEFSKKDIEEDINKAKDNLGESIMREADRFYRQSSSYISTVASNSVDAVRGIVIKSTAQEVVEQLKKLPESDQKEIRDAVYR